jgi:hypothetical protein
MTYFKHLLKPFYRATPEMVAAEELAMAELALLRSQSATEFAKSDVDYQLARIKRLRAYLAEAAKKVVTT